MRWQVTLHLPGQPVRVVASVTAQTAWEAHALALDQWPLLPPSCLWVDGEPLPALTGGAPGPTPGQALWRARKIRRRLAERHRQHWATKHTTPPVRED